MRGELLAATALAADQNRRVSAGDLSNLTQQRFDGRTLPEDRLQRFRSSGAGAGLVIVVVVIIQRLPRGSRESGRRCSRLCCQQCLLRVRRLRGKLLSQNMPSVRVAERSQQMWQINRQRVVIEQIPQDQIGAAGYLLRISRKYANPLAVIM